VTSPSYWLDLFSPTTWQEFLDSDRDVSGFRESRWGIVQSIKPGDYLLCYLTQVSRLVGVLDVNSEPYIDHSGSIWKDDAFPCRVKVSVAVALTVDTAIPITKLSDRLSMFQNLSNPNAWSGHVRGSPAKWKPTDGEVIIEALLYAQENPVVDPPPASQLRSAPKVVHTNKGEEVTIPSGSEDGGIAEELDGGPDVVIKQATSHTEIQWLLLKLGNDMGLDVWAARNDRGREFNGNRFASLPRLRSDLPQQFDEATNQTIELIDVLWLRKTTIVAAFEIESTTSIYSGLLRMSDLLSMQPNINIPLFLVAPDERRNKVLAEVNRPTFSRLSPPLKGLCRYLSFSVLRDQLPKDPRVIRYLTPNFLEEFSESCEIEQV